VLAHISHVVDGRGAERSSAATKSGYTFKLPETNAGVPKRK
jgi:hypothetical protein